MSRSTGPTKSTVRIVWNRDGGTCLKCGAWLRFEDRGTAWSIHHRAPRGMGGSKVAWINLPANLIVLCGSGVTGCHGWVETNRDEAYEAGWLIRRSGRNIAEHVVIRNGKHLIWLDDDGGKDYRLVTSGKEEKHVERRAVVYDVSERHASAPEGDTDLG